MAYVDDHPGAGMAIVALFGMMILIGTLALTSTLFRRLGLSRRSEPLGLPPGTVRATVALALIVLVAIVINSAQRPLGSPFQIKGQSSDAKAEIAREGKLLVLSSVAEACAKTPAEGTPCAAPDERYTLTVQMAQTPASLEMSKQIQAQLLQLLSTVIAFYFATRAVGKGVETGAAKPAVLDTQPNQDPKPEEDGSAVTPAAPIPPPPAPVVADAPAEPTPPPNAQ